MAKKKAMSTELKMELLTMLDSEVPQELLAVLYQEGELIMADSKENYVPVVTGRLRASGYVNMGVFAGKASKKEVILGFTAPYAMEVHERPPYMGQGKNKFLEKPVNKAMKGMNNRVAKKLAARIAATASAKANAKAAAKNKKRR